MRELVEGGILPAGCVRVLEALARCHLEHGSGVADRELLIGYGAHGDPSRVAARANSRAEPPVHLGIAEEAQLSRRWAIFCVLLLVQHDVVRRWYGGPHRDYAQNVQSVRHRHPRTGQTYEREHGIGGSGWANGYTVDGIPDPERPPEPEPELEPPPPPSDEVNSEGRERWQAIRRAHEEDRISRQRRRLGGDTRGP